jgi:hypothetical protein
MFVPQMKRGAIADEEERLVPVPSFRGASFAQN